MLREIMSGTTWRSTRTIGGVSDWLIDDAARDGIPPRSAWLVFWLPLAGWAILSVMFVVARPYYYVLLREDQVVEWGQFALCLFTAVVAVVAAWRIRRSSPWAAAFLLLVALGCFFLAGEEISWAQRVIGIETPAALSEANQQGELNLHNINAGFDPQMLFKLASVGLGLLGVVGVVVVRMLRRGGETFRLLAPPAVTIPGFAGIVAYFPVMLFDEVPAPLSIFQEWVECALYVSLTAAVLAIVLRTDPPGATRRLLIWSGLVVAAMTLTFAVLTAISGIKPGNVP